LGPAFSTATVIFLGDYNDRGPQVGGVIDWLVFLDKRYPKQKHVFLAGNHDFSFAGEVSASMSYFRENARHQCLCFFTPHDWTVPKACVFCQVNGLVLFDHRFVKL
jgi:hypothetical protein